MPQFKISANFIPAGDQPKAIKALVDGVHSNIHNQVLLGITGSGKTFTMANIIMQLDRPTLIMAHNKTLAAQISRKCRRIFCLLLRLLSARSIYCQL